MNYFENDFAVPQGDWVAAVGIESPDNTSEGELPKRWVLEDGKRVLLKGAGPLGQEPYNEALVTNLHGRLLQDGEFVAYTLRETSEGTVSCCPCFLTSEEEYIPAFYVRQLLRKPNHLNDYRHYIECCAALGIGDAELSLSKMLVCDDIIANHDRHWRNFGVIRNVETLECRMAPLFDSGSSLWCDVPTSTLSGKRWPFSAKPFYEDPNRQLRLVDDLEWLDFGAFDGFAEEVEDELRQNPQTADRSAYVAEGVRTRIRRIGNML